MLDATYAGREEDNLVKAKLAEGKTNVEAVWAAVEAARFTSDQALANLAKAVIRAPFKGSIVKAFFEVGEVPTIGAEVIRLADLTSFYFEAEADEIDVSSINVGGSAVIKLDAFGEEFRGTIIEVDLVSHTSPSGGTAYNVKIKFDEGGAVTLRSGLNGEAKVVKESKQGIVAIPSDFVYGKEGGNFVLVVEDGRSVEREVFLGEFVDGKYEITEGLEEGEIITRDIQK